MSPGINVLAPGSEVLANMHGLRPSEGMLLVVYQLNGAIDAQIVVMGERVDDIERISYQVHGSLRELREDQTLAFPGNVRVVRLEPIRSLLPRGQSALDFPAQRIDGGFVQRLIWVAGQPMKSRFKLSELVKSLISFKSNGSSEFSQ